MSLSVKCLIIQFKLEVPNPPAYTLSSAGSAVKKPREMIIAQCQKFHANEGVANKAPSHRRGMTHLSSSEK